VLLDALATGDAERGSGRSTEVTQNRVDQRRLADSGFTGDEPDLPASARRHAQPFGDLRALAGTTHERSIAARRVLGGGRPSTLRGERAGLRDEPVAPTRYRLDETRRGALVAERRSELADGEPDDVLRDRDVPPDRVEQRLLRHQLARSLHEVLEDGEGLRPQRHGHPVPAELAGAQIELEGGEIDDLELHPCCWLRTEQLARGGASSRAS